MLLSLAALANDETERHLSLGNQALNHNELTRAESEFRRVLKQLPDDPQALLGLANVYRRMARRDGRYPSDWKELMDKLQKSVDQHKTAKPAPHQEPLLFKKEIPVKEHKNGVSGPT